MEHDEAQHADDLAIQSELIRVIAVSTTRPLTRDEQMLLAWREGVTNEVYKGSRHGG